MTGQNAVDLIQSFSILCLAAAYFIHALGTHR